MVISVNNNNEFFRIVSLYAFMCVIFYPIQSLAANLEVKAFNEIFHYYNEEKEVRPTKDVNGRTIPLTKRSYVHRVEYCTIEFNNIQVKTGTSGAISINKLTIPFRYIDVSRMEGNNDYAVKIVAMDGKKEFLYNEWNWNGVNNNYSESTAYISPQTGGLERINGLYRLLRTYALICEP